MPPPKAKAAAEDSRSDVSITKEKPVPLAITSKKIKNGAFSQQQNGRSLKDLATASAEGSHSNPSGNHSTGMAWNTVPRDLLDAYRVSHHLSTPAAFASPLNQALLTNPGIGRQSPTMARKRDKRRVSKEQLALAVRKNFNGAAVNEIDVVVELVYKVRNQGKAFRMRSATAITKKP